MQLKWKWTVPNVLSLIRIVLVPVFVVFYQMSETDSVWFYWAIGVLVLSALSDFFDGIIARKFNQISEVGKLLDPVADKLTQVAVILCVALRHPQYLWLFLLCVVKEGLQLLGGLLLVSKNTKMDGAEWYGKLATGVFYFAMAFIVVADQWLTAYKSVTDVIAAVLIGALIVCMLIAFFGYARLFFQLKSEDVSETPAEKEE